jgi:phosphatidylinositol alpha-1,6-mannosyltransferase
MADHVLVTGELSDELLLSLYAAASLAVFPVKDLPGDVEGFGMVALEAAAHGLPTVAFAAGGVPDAVADGVSGNLLPAGDYEGMAARICRYLAGERGTVTAASCRAFAEQFAWPRFGERLRALLQDAPAS